MPYCESDMDDDSAVAPTLNMVPTPYVAPTQGNEELELQKDVALRLDVDDTKIEVESTDKEGDNKSVDGATEVPAMEAPSMFDTVLAPDEDEELCGPTTSQGIAMPTTMQRSLMLWLKANRG